MTITPAEVGILVGIAALLITAWVALAFAAGWRPLRRRRTVLVTLRTGETLRGVLVARHPTFLELARVEVLAGGGGASSTLDGTLEVDRDNVAWVQVP